MKINIGQILFFFLVACISGVAFKQMSKEDPPTKTYFYLDNEGRSHYLRTPEIVFLDEDLGCITNGKESIVCGVKHLRSIQE